mgnify:FL=1
MEHNVKSDHESSNFEGEPNKFKFSFKPAPVEVEDTIEDVNQSLTQSQKFRMFKVAAKPTDVVVV